MTDAHGCRCQLHRARNRSTSGISDTSRAHLSPRSTRAARVPPACRRSPRPVVTAGAPGHRPHSAVPPLGPASRSAPSNRGTARKGQATQAVLRSTDGGSTWSEPLTPGWIGACAPAQLAATADGAELLVDNMSEFTLRRSTDGGSTWAEIAVPLLPGQQPGFGVGIGTDGITLLPDGELLATGQGDRWLLLRPGSNAWCRVTNPGTGAPGSQTARSPSSATSCGG